jgi:hypothetical protein
MFTPASFFKQNICLVKNSKAWLSVASTSASFFSGKAVKTKLLLLLRFESRGHETKSGGCHANETQSHQCSSSEFTIRVSARKQILLSAP